MRKEYLHEADSRAGVSPARVGEYLLSVALALTRSPGRRDARPAPGRLTFACAVLLWSVFFGMPAVQAAGAAADRPPVVTKVRQLRLLSSQNPTSSYFIRLEGTVLWADPARGTVVLQDDSGAEELELDSGSQKAQVGRRIRVEGHGTITSSGAGVELGARGPVVDNNGVHSMIEKSGSVYLKAGLQPIRVEWFNGVEKFGLEVEYQGPSLKRQRIPAGVLFRVREGTTNLLNGLDYRCYEANAEVLPDFSELTPVGSGVASNFDLNVRSRDDHVAVEFEGYLQVPRDGLYTFYTTSDDGSRLFAGQPTFEIDDLGAGELPVPRPVALGQVLREGQDCQWCVVEGTVVFVGERAHGLELDLSSGAGRMRVEVADNSGLSGAALLNRRIRAVGVCQRTFTPDGQSVAGMLLVSGCEDLHLIQDPHSRSEAGKTNAGSNGLPVLTTAVEVHRLSRQQAQRGYPVRIRGVVTCVLPERQAFVIQDVTRGLYVVDASSSRSVPPQIGEFLAVEGTTDPSLFAPIVNARRVTNQGSGRLPDPVNPTWDQLLNGSLDAQYVEIQGVVTAVHTDGVTLLTRDGRIRLELRVTGLKPGDLAQYEDALVRVRGCLFASWDYVTHQVKPGEIRIYGADISVDQPAPTDLFSTPGKSVAALRLFDPQASVFQRVKVSGQIVHARSPEFFMMDGTNGARFIVKKAVDLKAGDRVEVVGFPELSGASPVLREAVARKIGRAPLPAPRKLEGDALIRGEYDSTLVRVEGVLVSIRETATDQLLEMQSGVRSFVARLSSNGDAVKSLPLGSRLELSGVYAGQGGNRAVGQDISSFELLLNSPAEIRVLARPPWWTLERLLIIVGALAFVLALTVLWITQLHRQVEERTAELAAQIRERQRVEHQRAMEQERARVAQDLHDELGSGITEISMLAARAKSASVPDERRKGYLEQVGQKARDLVTALDEIVWAMNPRHDSLASLVSYFSLYADRFLGLANIAWRLENPVEPRDFTLDSRHRHQLFLAFKEALTNVVRHSRATEVRLNIQAADGRVRFSISDNGCGLMPEERSGDMDGVANMRARIEKLGGRFEISGEPGRGTVVRFVLPTS